MRRFKKTAAQLSKKSRSAFTLFTVLLGSTTMAQATVFDFMGNYMYGGFTGPLAKGIAVPIFVLSCISMKHAEERAFQTSVVGGVASGGVLAAPLLTNEFRGALTGVLSALPTINSLPFLHSLF
jgi:type IV secretory pathway VirB2 component (pilin)